VGVLDSIHPTTRLHQIVADETLEILLKAYSPRADTAAARARSTPCTAS